MEYKEIPREDAIAGCQKSIELTAKLIDSILNYGLPVHVTMPMVQELRDQIKEEEDKIEMFRTLPDNKKIFGWVEDE